MTLKGKRVLFFAAPLYEDLELWYPKIRLEEEGASTTVAGMGEKTYPGKRGYPVTVDTNVDQIDASDFDALVIPGGFAPDQLRRSEKVLQLTREIYQAGKPVAFICHAGWVPISAKILKGKRATSVRAIKDDMENAGVTWEDSAVVVDGNLISSRTPADLPQFCKALIAALRHGPQDYAARHRTNEVGCPPRHPVGRVGDREHLLDPGRIQQHRERRAAVLHQLQRFLRIRDVANNRRRRSGAENPLDHEGLDARDVELAHGVPLREHRQPVGQGGGAEQQRERARAIRDETGSAVTTDRRAMRDRVTARRHGLDVEPPAPAGQQAIEIAAGTEDHAMRRQDRARRGLRRPDQREHRARSSREAPADPRAPGPAPRRPARARGRQRGSRAHMRSPSHSGDGRRRYTAAQREAECVTRRAPRTVVCPRRSARPWRPACSARQPRAHSRARDRDPARAGRSIRCWSPLPEAAPGDRLWGPRACARAGECASARSLRPWRRRTRRAGCAVRRSGA